MSSRIEQVKNNHKPKVAIFHYSGPPNISGVDVIIRDQARLFRLYGYRIEIVAGKVKQFRKDIPVHIIARINPKHPLVLSITEELEKGFVSSDFFRLEKYFYRSIKKYLLQNNIKVCILHNLFTRPYNLALSSALTSLVDDLPEIHFINWIHDVVYYHEPSTKLQRKLGDKYPWNLLIKPQPKLTYICVSNFLKADLVKAFGGSDLPRIDVIPNSLDIQKFLGLSPAMRSLYEDINGRECDLIACLPVRAIPRKNLELAIKIAKAIVDKEINFKLLLTANIDYKRKNNFEYYEYLKQLTKKLKLENNIIFLEEYFKQFATKYKPAPRIPIPELFLISDFLLFTSKLEGFGLPLIEAGLMRCPIFTVDIPPLREIGSTNINYFSTVDGPKKIAHFILRNINKMPQAYFYRKIIKNYSLHTTFKKLILPLIQDNNSNNDK